MADFAARNSSDVDLVLLGNSAQRRHADSRVRADGLDPVRFSQASEGVRVNAFRAAQMYTGMAARMTAVAPGTRCFHGSRFRRSHVVRLPPPDGNPGHGRGFSLPATRLSGGDASEKPVDPAIFLVAQPELKRRRQPFHLLRAAPSHNGGGDGRMVQSPSHGHHSWPDAMAAADLPQQLHQTQFG